MLYQLEKLKGTVLNFFFPQWCVGCGREGELICGYCLQSLSRIVPPLCPQCGKPQSNNILCSSCVNWQGEIAGIRSPYIFTGVIRQAIHELKYKNLRALAVPLANLLRDYIIDNPIPAEVLVPVPLHKSRLRERGYNQSNLLACELGKLVNLPVVDNCLLRQRHNPPQARTLSINERLSNVRDAFYCPDNSLSGRKILLIDDVATSGATLDACAAVLKVAGVLSVWGLVLAREI
ncbi:double zinc ribbon domain-containing protein [Chloroflexota bacterium]